MYNFILSIKYFCIGIGFTGLINMIVPVVLKVFLKKYYTKEKAMKIAIINTIFVYLFFCILGIIANQQMSSPAPMFIWGPISYAILKKNYNANIARYSKENNNIKENTAIIITKIIAIIIIICIALSIVGLLYYNFSSKINELNEKISILEREKEELSIKNFETSINNSLENNELNFWREHTVIVPVNSRIYHTYRCDKWDNSSYYIYSKNDAIAEGYKPCSDCINK